jgi:hypothetical protein
LDEMENVVDNLRLTIAMFFNIPLYTINIPNNW